MAEEEKRNTTLAEYLHIAFHLILTGSYKVSIVIFSLEMGR